MLIYIMRACRQASNLHFTGRLDLFAQRQTGSQTFLTPHIREIADFSKYLRKRKKLEW